jgi:benzodiazapine receptor
MVVFSLPALGATLLPFAGAIPGSIITKKNRGWYDHVEKPSWRPPPWVFGPVWSCLYASMGYASYLAYNASEGSVRRTAMTLYATQLALNWSWTPVFFGQHNAKGAFYTIVALWCNVLACGYQFYKIDPTPGYMMAPYLAWVSLASALNYWIWNKNGDRPAGKPETKAE